MAYFWNKTVKETAREVQEISWGWVKGESPPPPHSRFFALLHDFAFLLLLTNSSVSGVIQSSSTRSTCHSIHLISSVQFLNYYPVAVLCFSRNSMTSTSTSIILLLLSYLFELLIRPFFTLAQYFYRGAVLYCVNILHHRSPQSSNRWPNVSLTSRTCCLLFSANFL